MPRSHKRLSRLSLTFPLLLSTSLSLSSLTYPPLRYRPGSSSVYISSPLSTSSSTTLSNCQLYTPPNDRSDFLFSFTVDATTGTVHAFPPLYLPVIETLDVRCDAHEGRVEVMADKAYLVYAMPRLQSVATGVESLVFSPVVQERIGSASGCRLVAALNDNDNLDPQSTDTGFLTEPLSLPTQTFPGHPAQSGGVRVMDDGSVIVNSGDSFTNRPDTLIIACNSHEGVLRLTTAALRSSNVWLSFSSQKERQMHTSNTTSHSQLGCVSVLVPIAAAETTGSTPSGCRLVHASRSEVTHRAQTTSYARKKEIPLTSSSLIPVRVHNSGAVRLGSALHVPANTRLHLLIGCAAHEGTIILSQDKNILSYTPSFTKLGDGVTLSPRFSCPVLPASLPIFDLSGAVDLAGTSLLPARCTISSPEPKFVPPGLSVDPQGAVIVAKTAPAFSTSVIEIECAQHRGRLSTARAGLLVMPAAWTSFNHTNSLALIFWAITLLVVALLLCAASVMAWCFMPKSAPTTGEERERQESIEEEAEGTREKEMLRSPLQSAFSWRGKGHGRSSSMDDGGDRKRHPKPPARVENALFDASIHQLRKDAKTAKKWRQDGQAHVDITASFRHSDSQESDLIPNRGRGGGFGSFNSDFLDFGERESVLSRLSVCDLVGKTPDRLSRRSTEQTNREEVHSGAPQASPVNYGHLQYGPSPDLHGGANNPPMGTPHSPPAPASVGFIPRTHGNPTHADQRGSSMSPGPRPPSMPPPKHASMVRVHRSQVPGEY